MHHIQIEQGEADFAAAQPTMNYNRYQRADIAYPMFDRCVGTRSINCTAIFCLFSLPLQGFLLQDSNARARGLFQDTPVPIVPVHLDRNPDVHLSNCFGIFHALLFEAQNQPERYLSFVLHVLVEEMLRKVSFQQLGSERAFRAVSLPLGHLMAVGLPYYWLDTQRQVCKCPILHAKPQLS